VGILVVVDEDALAALLLPPLRRHAARHAPLQLAPERDRGVAHVGERPARLDPHVDVDAAAAGRLREARIAQLLQQRARLGGDLHRVGEDPVLDGEVVRDDIELRDRLRAPASTIVASDRAMPTEFYRLSSPTPMQEIPIRDDTIRLGQLLKLAGLADSGGEAKELLAEGAVSVNGETEERRGRQLRSGDVVQVGDEQVRVA
jgi:ribosome-associated protein